jgi:hypothetical protein
MGALKKEKPASNLVLGPHEKIVSRLTVRDVCILRPPPKVSTERMLKSVHWIGRRWGDLALAEHLLAYPKLIDRMQRKMNYEYYLSQLDFPGATRTRACTGENNRPFISVEHVTLSRLGGDWHLFWDPGDYGHFVVAYTKPN